LCASTQTFQISKPDSAKWSRLHHVSDHRKVRIVPGSSSTV
jgi:hypothetical protein